MEQSPSWEANSNSASQEIPCLLWNFEGLLPCSQEPVIGLWFYSLKIPHTFLLLNLFHQILPHFSSTPNFPANETLSTVTVYRAHTSMRCTIRQCYVFRLLRRRKFLLILRNPLRLQICTSINHSELPLSLSLSLCMQSTVGKITRR